MSYFIKYKLPFVSDRGNVYDLHILQKNYAGQPIVKKLGVAPVLSIEDGEGRVKGSSLSFAVQADVEGELKGLYTTNNKEFKVLLYKNSSLYWQGFVLPELYSENYIDPPYDVAVTASDQLGVLKNVEYQQEAGYKSLLEIIAYTLSITHLDLKIVQHLNLTLAGKERFLDGAYVATEGYYGQSCYDVLNSILLSCNACIQQYGNEWVIMSLTDVSTSYNKDGVNIEIPHAQLGQMGSAQVYPDGSLEMVNKPAVKGVTLNYAHVLKNSFLKNADCQSKDGWQYSFEPLDNRLPGTVDEFGVIYKCNCWQLPQKDVTVSGELQLWQDVNVKADNTYNCQLSVDYRMDLGASLLLMAIIHEGVDGITRRLTSEGWKEGVSDTDRNSYINVTGTPSELWLTWAKDIADFSKYEKTTVQFRLPDVDGVLRIGFINTSETSFVNPLSGYVYITKVYLTYMGITGKASTTVVEEDATNAQEEISLAYGERVPATNEALAVLNTLRSASGVPREQFSLNNTSGVKSYDSYFLAMLQEMSRYYAVKKMHLQGVVMGVSPLYLLYKDVFSGKVMRLVSGEYDLLQDTLGVLLEEVPDAWVDYEPEVYATDNSVPGVSSPGVVTVGGGGGTSLFAVNAKGEVYVKDERVLSGAEADFGKVVLPAEKPEESSDKVYIYSQVPAADEQLDNKVVNVHLMVDELVELRDDFDALNDLLNSDVAGVINTWDEIVDFLNEYGESQDLASILSQMNTDIANRVLYTDFGKLEDAVDSNYKSISNIASTIPTIESNISTLATRVSSAESVITTIQSTYVDKASAQEINGVKTFKNGLKIGDAELVWDSTNKALKIVGSAYITEDLSFGGYQAPGGGGTSGGGIVTIKVNGQEYTSQNGIVTLPNYPSLAGYATEDYVTSRGYITNAALNGYATLVDIPTSLPASDVYSWAKAATKPTYTASEVGALSVNGGRIVNYGVIPLELVGGAEQCGEVFYDNSLTAKAQIGWANDIGTWIYNYESGSYLHVRDDGTPCYNGYILYHTGNFNPTNYLPLSGGTIVSDSFMPLILDSNNNQSRLNFRVGGADKALVGWNSSEGAWLYSCPGGSYLHIKDDGTPCYNGNPLFHAGNANRTSVSWAASNILFPQGTSATWNVHTTGAYKGITILNTVGEESEGAPISYAVGLSVSGYYGFTLAHYGGEALYWLKGSGNANWYALIHSGNIGEQSVNYATSTGSANGLVAASSTYDYIVGIERTSTFYDWSQSVNGGYFYGLQMESPDVNYKMQIARQLWTAGLFWRECNGSSTYGDWVTIVDGNNISLYNAGSATKLQTARTIWGQSFDGSGDVDGKIYQEGKWILGCHTDGNLYIGFDTYSTNDTLIYGRNLYFGTYSGYSMLINSSGNVLMGTTEDRGYRLQVEGSFASYSYSGEYGTLGTRPVGASLFGPYVYGLLTWVRGDGNAYMQVGRTDNQAIAYNLVMQHLGGNVLIGTTSDNGSGAKLQVAGNLTVAGDITFGSDARYKNKITDVEIDLATIANAPLFNYRWNNREDNREHLGTTAQYWYNTAFKNAVVPTNDEKLWTMSYSEIAMGNTIILAREQIKIKSEVEQLKEKVRQLEDELEKYRRVA